MKDERRCFTNKELGTIKAFMEKYELSWTNFGDILGISPQVISRYVKLKQHIPASVVERIFNSIEIYDITMSYSEQDNSVVANKQSYIISNNIAKEIDGYFKNQLYKKKKNPYQDIDNDYPINSGYDDIDIILKDMFCLKKKMSHMIKECGDKYDKLIDLYEGIFES